MILEFKQNPKIISILREKAPESIIIGFKLGINEDKIINDAKFLIKKHNLNFVVANDISAIDSDKTKVFLIDRNGNKKICKGYKLNIADEILDFIINN